jgi:hypothetical protein
MRTCAYCGSDSKLTKEHILPRCIYKRTPDHDLQIFKSKSVGGELTVGDVCNTCNNVALSQLDNYICKLFDLYFYQVILQNQTVDFQYNFHYLTRWLLKTSYNSARTQQDNRDSKLLAQYTDYILGNSLCPSKLAIYVQLITPYPIPKEKKDEMREFVGNAEYLPPEYERIAKVIISDNSSSIGLLRLVAIKSFYFYIVTPSSISISEKRWKQTLYAVQSNLGGLFKLGYNHTRITLRASNINVLDMMRKAVVIHKSKEQANFNRS